MAVVVREHRDLLVLGGLLECALLVFLATGLQRGTYTMGVVYLLPFALYLVAVWRMVWHRDAEDVSQSWVLVLLFALLFHVTLLFSPTSVSDDIFRYEWDGKVVSEGFNPYAYSPADQELRYLRDANWARVQNKTVDTMYPPVAQLVFVTLHQVYPGIMGLRLASVLFSMGAAFVIVLILKELRLPVTYAVVYGWSPLVALEFGNSGHIDSLAVLCTALCFLALLKNRPALSGAALALGVLSKIYPLLFAGLFLYRWGKRGMVSFAVVLVALCLPFLGAGKGLLDGSAYFIAHGLFNGSLFPMVLGALRLIVVESLALPVAKALVFCMFVCLLAILGWRSWRRKADALLVWRRCLFLTGGFILLSPTVHPWYLTWLLPFLCVFPELGWIVLTGTSILARFVYVGYEATGAWRELWWARLGEYAPAYVLMAYGARRRFGAWCTSLLR